MACVLFCVIENTLVACILPACNLSPAARFIIEDIVNMLALLFMVHRAFPFPRLQWEWRDVTKFNTIGSRRSAR